ncbi:3-deoxy-D-manno-octulosonic acid transferase [Psychromonas marina]|uniref:3-deoxy-D-manno-octulosonic acid transferase n=1 Tax=Psychromonas marina TaxID=88364 RepID=A0ABQ6E5D2_9GAMM|nr:lipid IV(A) 3-deoxy-D-manno-octulosonic acid transferase [Psychromonas marina]GLS92621.1 3-deoxy-D-manno-octulosonic acid transferase [Psychromonas marina]
MIIRCLYSILLFIIAPFFLYGLYKSKPNKPKFGSRWKEHFGVIPQLKESKDAPIWIHAVSVGELLAVIPLIKKLKADNPAQSIVITTTTSTGAAEADKLDDLVEHRYMPLDFSFAIKRFIKTIKPKTLFIMETELWPNTLACCQQKNIPIAVINARLSQRSANRYKKFPAVFNILLKNINLVLAQTEQDAQRFIDLGMKPEQVNVTGSIKFDISVSQQQTQQAATLRHSFDQNREVWIAASTHKGEDEQIIAAHQQLLLEKPNALLILVPRHPERFLSVKTLSENSGLSVVTRSSQQPIENSTQLYLGDSMGEMMVLLGVADICFIAGSLIGDKVGGHNLLEAAALKKPILNGPSYFNFKQITEQLVKLNACTICQNSNEISANLLKLFNDANLRQQQGKAALDFVLQNQGALNKTALTIKNYQAEW